MALLLGGLWWLHPFGVLSFYDIFQEEFITIFQYFTSLDDAGLLLIKLIRMCYDVFRFSLKVHFM